MKKITFCLMMLLSIVSFSQVEIVEDFDALSNGQIPAGWTGTDFGASSTFACGGSGNNLTSLFTTANVGQSRSILTNDLTAATNGDIVASFSYKVYQATQFRPTTYGAPAAGWGSLTVEYSTDSGVNWTNITTIDDSNYVYVDPETCTDSPVFTLTGIPTGNNFQVRFTATASVISSNFLFIEIDNVSFASPPTEVPNCDAVLVAPVNGDQAVELSSTMSWTKATGQPIDYLVSIGTSSGATDILNAAPAATTSYDLSGLLAYDTEYFVTITPTNGIGSATGCTEESFKTRLEPIAGATCSKPIVVSSFPYLTADDTEKYEDNIDASPCSNSYMNGNDVFYEITPDEDMSINISLTDVDENGASIHVVEGCPDGATECIAYVGTFSAAAARELTEVVLLKDVTYFVVLSNSGATRTYAYNLFIEKNNCINPSLGVLTPVADCANGQFSVDVDVSYLGNASSLTLSDDDDTTADMTGITATGIVTMGPYPSGTTVNFTLTNDGTTCSYSDSTYFYCPPTNDECGAPISLTVNTDDTCTIFTSASNAGATESTNEPDNCSGSTNSVWFSFEATSATTILEYLNVVEAPGTSSGAIIQNTELLEGTCDALTSLGCYSGSYTTFSGLTVGKTYYILNRSNTSGDYAQNFDICLKEAPTPPTNDDCASAVSLTLSTDNTCDNKYTGTTVGATVSSDNDCNTSTAYKDVWHVFTPTETAYYEFQFTKIDTSPISYYSIYEGTCGALTMVSGSCSSSSNEVLTLNSGTSYYVMVRSSSTGPGIAYDLCLWQRPEPDTNTDCATPATFLESTDANGNNKIVSNLNNAYYSPEDCGSASYESLWYEFTPSYTGTYNFELVRTSGSATYTIYDSTDCSNLNYIGGDINSCYESGTDSGPVVAGKTYKVLIHASSAAEFEFFAYPDPSLSTESLEFENFKYFPNPVVNTLTVEARNSISNISVINIIGQEVKVLKPNSLKTSIDMNNLNNGVYFVRVSINNAVKTFRVIKK